MKKSLLFIYLISSYLTFSQNLVQFGDFEYLTYGGLPKETWQGSRAQVLDDDLTNSNVINLNNNDATGYQIIDVVPNSNYEFHFDYRWLSGSGTYNLTATINEYNTNIGDAIVSFVCDTEPDIWKSSGKINFTVPEGVNQVAVNFSKSGGQRPFRFDNVIVYPEGYIPPVITPRLIDQSTYSKFPSATPVPFGEDIPNETWTLDFSDEFETMELEASVWKKSFSSKTRNPRNQPTQGIDDWWFKPENVSVDGSDNLVLTGTKVDDNTMYCGSVETVESYQPTYGYFEARIKIASTEKGNHTAFWLTSATQGNIGNGAADGAEIDIFESTYVADRTAAVIHYDGYGPEKGTYTVPYLTPGIHDGFHVYGLHWTPTFMDLYYDGKKVVSNNSNRPLPFTVHPFSSKDGINPDPLVPQVPEWIWLSVGASFNDGNFQAQDVGRLSDALVDYVRVFKSESTVLSNNETVLKETFKIYPVPTNDLLYINTKEPSYTLKLVDLTGKVLINAKKSNTTSIDVSHFSKGMYIMQLITTKGNIMKRIIIE
tara:strand:- start:25609 stop:27231 length:1623 start_codon:yes stop_codon:yes gene_type:complete